MLLKHEDICEHAHCNLQEELGSNCQIMFDSYANNDAFVSAAVGYFYGEVM